MAGLRTFVHEHKSALFAAVLGAIALTAVSPAPTAAYDRFLALVHTQEVSTAVSFVASERFRVGNVIGDRRVASIGTNFTTYFGTLVERYAPPASLAVWELPYPLADTSIMMMLGGSSSAVTHLSHIYAIMERGMAGANHMDWQSNIAFLRSPVDRRLWAIHWSVDHSGAWSIGAVKVPHAGLDWAAGTRVLAVPAGAAHRMLNQTLSGIGE